MLAASFLFPYLLERSMGFHNTLLRPRVSLLSQVGKHVRIQRSGPGVPAGHVARGGGGPRQESRAARHLQRRFLR